MSAAEFALNVRRRDVVVGYWISSDNPPATERIVSLRSGSIARNRATCQVASSAVQAIRHAALERRTGEQPTSMPNTAPMQGSKAQAGSW